MIEHWRQRMSRAVGLRVAVWYAGVFIITSAAIGLIAYQLLAISLERRDHDLLLVRLAEYAGTYERDGLPAVTQAINAERASGSRDAVMVRLVGGGGAEVQFFSLPPAWRTYDIARLDGRRPYGDDWEQVQSTVDTTTLEVVSRSLWDGTILQVGRTTIERDQFLAQVRDLLGIMIVCVVVAGLAGGIALTRSALQPLRELRDTVRDITETGRLDARVAADGDGDLVDELGVVFNAMLTRIETLVGGMRDALDNVAHDLRTPIARLRARAEAALASARGDDPAARDALAACVEEADRVMALLTTMMDISEAETGTMRLSLSAVPVDEIVHDTIELYEDTADERGIALSSTAAPDLVVRGDRQRLRQVLANLVDNALKFTDAGGRVTIGAEARGDEVVIAVRDTGRGIPPTDLPRIWDRLYRGDASHAQGLGLGLSLVRAIVTAHGGRAEVESEVGKGTGVTVTLPRSA
jgi:signal transduction histidine kinase